TEADAVAQDVTPSVTRNVTQDVTRDVMRAQSVSQTDLQTAAIRDEVSGEICNVCKRDDEGRRNHPLIHCDTCQGLPEWERIDESTGEVLDFTPAAVDPWKSPVPKVLCAQCSGWVGADREKAGMTVCGPCARGERKAS
ncbi:MAG: hypothetical protein GX595_19200, partial [Lentisphaerae bacterium]|nr:hypothetical protein [Lentisphaerota bacterium]